MKLFNVETFQSGLVKSVLFNIFSKSLGFLTTLFIAYYFGSGKDSDIYFFVLTTSILFASVVSNLNGAVIIPEAIRIREQESKIDSISFLNRFFYLYIFIALVFITSALIFPDFVFDLISGFPDSVIKEHFASLLLLLPLIFLMVITNYFIDILNSYRYFTLPVIATILNNVLILGYVFLGGNRYGIEGILLASIIAYFLVAVLFYTVIIRKLDWKFGLGSYKIKSKVWKNVGFAQSGNFFTLLAVFAPVYFFTGLQQGSMSALSYSQKVFEIPISFFVNQLSVVVGIKFNELHAHHDYSELNGYFIFMAKLSSFILVPIAVIMVTFSHEIIELLFLRGQFNHESIAVSAFLLQYLAVAVPFVALNTISARLMMASQNIKFSFYYQIVSNIILLLMIKFSIDWIGVIGYPVSFSISYISHIIFFWFYSKYLFPFLIYFKVIADFTKITLLCTVIIVPVLSFLYFFDITGFIRLISGVLLFVPLVFASVYFTRTFPEMNTFLGKYLRKIQGYKLHF